MRDASHERNPPRGRNPATLIAPLIAAVVLFAACGPVQPSSNVWSPPARSPASLADLVPGEFGGLPLEKRPGSPAGVPFLERILPQAGVSVTEVEFVRLGNNEGPEGMVPNFALRAPGLNVDEIRKQMKLIVGARTATMAGKEVIVHGGIGIYHYVVDDMWFMFRANNAAVAERFVAGLP